MEVIATTRSTNIVIAILIAIVIFCFSYLIARSISLKSGRKPKQWLIIILAVVSLGIGYGAGYAFGSAYSYSLIKGDFSSHKCVICKQPSSYEVKIAGGISNWYCSKHYDSAKDQYERYATISSQVHSSSHSNERKCESCGRKFSDSTNINYIVHTNMCRNCYRNFCSMTGKKPTNYDKD